MAKLLLYTDFTGVWNIPNLDTTENQENFEEFLTENEYKWGQKTLGYELYSNLVASYDYGTQDEWEQLWLGADFTNQDDKLQKYEGIKNMLRYFLCFQWYFENQTFALSIGQRQINGNSTEKVSSRGFLADLHSKGLKIHKDTYYFINAINDATPETYENYEQKIIESINIFDI